MLTRRFVPGRNGYEAKGEQREVSKFQAGYMIALNVGLQGTCKHEGIIFEMDVHFEPTRDYYIDVFQGAEVPFLDYIAKVMVLVYEHLFTHVSQRNQYIRHLEETHENPLLVFVGFSSTQNVADAMIFAIKENDVDETYSDEELESLRQTFMESGASLAQILAVVFESEYGFVDDLQQLIRLFKDKSVEDVVAIFDMADSESMTVVEVAEMMTA